MRRAFAQTFRPSGSRDPYWRQARGRNSSTIMRAESPLLLTGQYGEPSWPRSDAYEKVSLPRAITKRQAKAEARLAAKGGVAYLNPRLRREQIAA